MYLQILVYCLGLIVTSIVFALLEIQIEGPVGWAKNLPTWRIDNKLVRFFYSGKPLTGYHFYTIVFIFLMTHAPWFIGLAVPTWRGEARILSFNILFWVLEDFLWFVLNPAFGLKKFRKENIWWHAPAWWWVMPRDYWFGLFAGVAMFVASVWQFHA